MGKPGFITNGNAGPVIKSLLDRLCDIL